ncbi:MAG: protein-L-isoaspartate(D-aspartate) O-methyltransferase [Pseudomonadota bacterium]
MTSRRTRARLVERLRAQGIKSEMVLRAIYEVPRHLFVEEALASRAYEDSALPIGYGQTLSQPWTVAHMTEVLLAGGPLQRVLEIGTGSGYQTAVLAALVPYVYSIERLAFFHQQAQARFREMGLTRIVLRHGDGARGWPEKAPFDGILVTAAAGFAPEALIAQLQPGGRLVMPLGEGRQQRLVVFRRDAQGVQMETLTECCFVPLLSGVC